MKKTGRLWEDSVRVLKRRRGDEHEDETAWWVTVGSHFVERQLMCFPPMKIHTLNSPHPSLDPRKPSDTEWFDDDVSSEIVDIPGPILITRELIVDRVEIVDGPPSYAPIIKGIKTAFILSGKPFNEKDKNGKLRSNQ